MRELYWELHWELHWDLYWELLGAAAQRARGKKGTGGRSALALGRRACGLGLGGASRGLPTSAAITERERGERRAHSPRWSF